MSQLDSSCGRPVLEYECVNASFITLDSPHSISQRCWECFRQHT